jgi:hypothetical protein
MDHIEVNEMSCREVSKSQSIRLLDIFFIAPFLLYIGYKATGINNTEKMVLILIALATFYYNGKNYLETKK